MSLRDASWFFSIVLAVGIICWLAWMQPPKSDVSVAQVAEANPWQSYTSKRYSVSFEHPASWRVLESRDPLEPMITVFDPSEGQVPEPLALDAENRSHVSLYPRGLPTKDIFGVQRSSNLTLPYRAQANSEYVLANGSIWARRISFVSIPFSWGPQGFVWAQNRIDGSVAWCERESQKIDDRLCDPLFGDRYIRDGGVSEQKQAILDRIIGSITFSVEQDSDVSEALNLEKPEANQYIRNPVALRGTAPSSWFFENSFLIQLFDSNGVILGESAAVALVDSYTVAAVPFEAYLSYADPETSAGYLVLTQSSSKSADADVRTYRQPVLFR